MAAVLGCHSPRDQAQPAAGMGLLALGLLSPRGRSQAPSRPGPWDLQPGCSQVRLGEHPHPDPLLRHLACPVQHPCRQNGDTPTSCLLCTPPPCTALASPALLPAVLWAGLGQGLEPAEPRWGEQVSLLPPSISGQGGCRDNTAEQWGSKVCRGQGLAGGPGQAPPQFPAQRMPCTDREPRCPETHVLPAPDSSTPLPRLWGEPRHPAPVQSSTLGAGAGDSTSTRSESASSPGAASPGSALEGSLSRTCQRSLPQTPRQADESRLEVASQSLHVTQGTPSALSLGGPWGHPAGPQQVPARQGHWLQNCTLLPGHPQPVHSCREGKGPRA